MLATMPPKASSASSPCSAAPAAPVRPARSRVSAECPSVLQRAQHQRESYQDASRAVTTNARLTASSPEQRCRADSLARRQQKSHARDAAPSSTRDTVDHRASRQIEHSTASRPQRHDPVPAVRKCRRRAPPGAQMQLTFITPEAAPRPCRCHATEHPRSRSAPSGTGCPSVCVGRTPGISCEAVPASMPSTGAGMRRHVHACRNQCRRKLRQLHPLVRPHVVPPTSVCRSAGRSLPELPRRYALDESATTWSDLKSHIRRGPDPVRTLEKRGLARRLQPRQGT